MRNSVILMLLGTAILLITLSVTRNISVFGILIGYWLGFIYSWWLYRDTLRCVQDEVKAAVARMRRSFFARLGFVTLVVIAVARFKIEWLFPVAVGIGVGLVFALFSTIRHDFLSRKG